MNLATNNEVVKAFIVKAINASTEWQLVPLFKIGLLFLFYSRLFFTALSIHILSHLTFVYSYISNIKNKRSKYSLSKVKYKINRYGSPPFPFSVSINDVVIDKSSIVLSAIRIAPSWCQPSVQRVIKDIHFTKMNKRLHKTSTGGTRRYKGLSTFLISLLYSSCTPLVHAIPGYD